MVFISVSLECCLDPFCQPGPKVCGPMLMSLPFFATASSVPSDLQWEHSDTSMAGLSKPAVSLGPQLIAYSRPISYRIVLLSTSFSLLSCKKPRRQKWLVPLCTHSLSTAGLQSQFIILRRGSGLAWVYISSASHSLDGLWGSAYIA